MHELRIHLFLCFIFKIFYLRRCCFNCPHLWKYIYVFRTYSFVLYLFIFIYYQSTTCALFNFMPRRQYDDHLLYYYNNNNNIQHSHAYLSIFTLRRSSKTWRTFLHIKSFHKINIYQKKKCIVSMIFSSIFAPIYLCDQQLWFRGVRPSKFRHVYGLPSRKESCYTDISAVRSGNDGNFCAVNQKLIAIVADTMFVVFPVGQVYFTYIAYCNNLYKIKFKLFMNRPVALTSNAAK